MELLFGYSEAVAFLCSALFENDTSKKQRKGMGTSGREVER